MEGSDLYVVVGRDENGSDMRFWATSDEYFEEKRKGRDGGNKKLENGLGTYSLTLIEGVEDDDHHPLVIPW